MREMQRLPMRVKLNERGLQWLHLGLFLFFLSLGSMFSIELVRYGYYLLLIVAVVLIGSMSHEFKKPLTGPTLVLWAGVLGLMLFVGIQTPQLPLKGAVIIISVLIILYGIWASRKILPLKKR